MRLISEGKKKELELSEFSSALKDWERSPRNSLLPQKMDFYQLTTDFYHFEHLFLELSHAHHLISVQDAVVYFFSDNYCWSSFYCNKHRTLILAHQVYLRTKQPTMRQTSCQRFKKIDARRSTQTIVWIAILIHFHRRHTWKILTVCSSRVNF